jgi:hypothetical protein
MFRKIAVCAISIVLVSGVGVIRSRALPVTPSATSLDNGTSIELVAKTYMKKKGHNDGHRHVKDRDHRHGHVNVNVRDHRHGHMNMNVRVHRGHWHGHRYRNRHGAYIYFYNGYYYPTPWWTLGYTGYDF